MGVSAFIMLPVALELAAEVVWKVASPATTSAVLYLLGNGEFFSLLLEDSGLRLTVCFFF